MNSSKSNDGQAMMRLIEELYPICRSLTGNGVRETLRIIGRSMPLKAHEVPTGTKVFDWTVPKEWNIRDAYVKDSKGRRVIDFRKSNLHVVGYSAPVHTRMTLAELKPHLHTLPDHPDWIPQRNSYYQETWGFCLTHNQFRRLRNGSYAVRIDSTLRKGHLTYGECLIRGRTTDEVLVSCHVCHPSLCNDNLSGIAVATRLAARLTRRSLRYSYRFLFIPSTIGSITWLARNETRARRIKHGLVLTCVGDAGSSTYKKSRRGDAEIDRAALHVLKHAGSRFAIQDFIPYGYDERQYCSPAFDLPMGCLMRTPNGKFPEYHTSADNLNFVKPRSLEDSLAKASAIVEVLEGNRRYRNRNPKCEPQLGRRGLYRSMGGGTAGSERELAMLWVLNQSDGTHDLLDIADRAGMKFDVIQSAAEALCAVSLLQECK